MPNRLKTSIIRQIYKTGCKIDYNNYRPIVILSVVEKILEEIVVKRLRAFLEKYNIIHPNQFGFQKGKNINKLLGNFSNYINSCLSQNMHCLALFIDFSKAFDTLSHKKLISMLERIGIRGVTINWFKNYLDCRSYRVKINNLTSEEIKIDCGVPKGSKLGPILYIIYANEMLKYLNSSKIFTYADDTAIIVSNQNIQQATNLMQNQLDITNKWCHDNGLIINASKTKLMHIKPKHLPETQINLTIHNTNCLHNKTKNPTNNIDTCTTTIETVKTYKYLGVFVDSTQQKLRLPCNELRS